MKFWSGWKLKIAYNTLAQLMGKIISAGSNFLITILIARHFGASGFGDFSKIFSLVAVFYLISDFGLNAVYIKEVGSGKWEAGDDGGGGIDEKRNIDKLLNSLLGLRFFGALVLIFLFLALTVFLPFNPVTGYGFSPLVKLGMVIASLTILTQSLLTTANAYFQKQMRYDKSVAAVSVGSLLILGLVWWLMRINGGLLFVVGSYVVGSLVVVLLAIWLAHWPVWELRLNQLINRASWQRLFWQSWPLGLTLIFNVVYVRTDVLLLSIYRGSSEVGFYSLAYKVFDFLLVAPTFLMNAVYPLMVKRLKEQGLVRLRQLVKITGIILLNCSMVILLLTWYLSPWLRLVKVEFGPAILLLRILSLSLPFFYLSSLLMWFLITLKKQKLLMMIYGLGLLFNVAVNLIFIPRFGAVAAAIITGVSEGVILGMSGYYGLKFLRSD